MGKGTGRANGKGGKKAFSQSKKGGKKKVAWHSTYGGIEVEEQTYSQTKGSTRLRPFLFTSQVSPRGYSKVLERRISDFGADMAFGKVNEKLKEHYGITVPSNGIRAITLKHGKAIKAYQEKQLGKASGTGKAGYVISQTDGSMVPIVKTLEVAEKGTELEVQAREKAREKPSKRAGQRAQERKNVSEIKGLVKKAHEDEAIQAQGCGKPVKPQEEEGKKKVDRRKGKTLYYREAKLTLAHKKDSVIPTFSATFGDAKEAGRHVLHCVKAVGVNKETKIHAVGDGAVWIANQLEEQFGKQANYLVDFYHLCEYLSAAAPMCSVHEKDWIEQQKQRLKANEWRQVLSALHRHVEPSSTAEEKAPVRACYRYIQNRTHQLDYKTAIENELPIGSGEIESAHRYVIQKRLKIAGAWWLEENACYMLALRVCRANNQWDEYWKNRPA